MFIAALSLALAGSVALVLGLGAAVSSETVREHPPEAGLL
jgi:hypothetical protein